MAENQKKKVLVIDDDLSLIRILEKRLQAQNYVVLGALNGVSGIKMAKEESPDVILLDVKLPDLTGAYVSKKLNADEATKSIPIIFITVTISKQKDKQVKHMEVDGQVYPAFAKPLFFPKLLSTIRDLIKETNS